MQKESSRRLPGLIKDQVPVRQHLETMARRAYFGGLGGRFQCRLARARDQVSVAGA